jgi:hypothetical protein
VWHGPADLLSTPSSFFKARDRQTVNMGNMGNYEDITEGAENLTLPLSNPPANSISLL